MCGAPVAQPAEAVDLKSIQCGFESRRGHYKHGDSWDAAVGAVCVRGGAFLQVSPLRLLSGGVPMASLVACRAASRVLPDSVARLAFRGLELSCFEEPARDALSEVSEVYLAGGQHLNGG